MPKLAKKLTDTIAGSLPAPTTGYTIFWDAGSPGFGLRVGASGARAWITERRVDGQTVRRVVGAASGRNAISCNAARALQLKVSSELAEGTDRNVERRERDRQRKADELLFGDALRAFATGKRRRDGKPLKDRTVTDYVRMLAPSREKHDGTITKAGELHALVDRPVRAITAAEIHRLYAGLQKRGSRSADLAMAVLRATLNWHGVKLPHNPLSRDTAEKDRIKLAPPRARGEPIPAQKIGAWWTAACAIKGRYLPSADLLRTMVLTGCRGGELRTVTVQDVDLDAGRVTLRDTKARNDHIVYLSSQAAEIVARNAAGKTGADLLFGIADPGRVLASINRAAGVEGVAPHGLRKTFATLASELLPGATVKRLLNHVDANDITATHYVRQSEAALRGAWQAVADFIAAQAIVKEFLPGVAA